MDAEAVTAPGRSRRWPLAAVAIAAVVAVWLASRSPPAPPPAAPAAAPQEDWALRLYQQPGNELRILEVRPLRRTIESWRIAVPLAERDALVDFRTGVPGAPPQQDEDAGRIEATFNDPRFGELWMVGADTPIGPGRSAYLGLRRRPTTLYVGSRGAPLEPLDPARLTRR